MANHGEEKEKEKLKCPTVNSNVSEEEKLNKD